MSDATTSRAPALLLGLIVGMVIYVGTLSLGGPLLRYLPGSGEWTWHPPLGVVSMGYYGLVINGAMGWLLGAALASLPPMKRLLSSRGAIAKLESAALIVTLLSLLAIVTLEMSRSHGAHPEQARALEVGDLMPEFSLQDERGEHLSRADLLGQGPVVIYFYPKDNTQGCTAQAISFRDDFPNFVAAGARIVGVSSDSVASHEAFCSAHSLPFTLLSDPEERLRRAFGVPKTLGLIAGRVTYVINSQGVIAHIFDAQLAFDAHASEALEVVRRLSAEGREARP